jgi:hypothetical protein
METFSNPIHVKKNQKLLKTFTKSKFHNKVIKHPCKATIVSQLFVTLSDLNQKIYCQVKSAYLPSRVLNFAIVSAKANEICFYLC